MTGFWDVMAGLFGRGTSRPAPVLVPAVVKEPLTPTPAVVAPARPALSEADLLRAAMDQGGITDNELRAGIAAIAMGESAMRGHVETGYARTDNARIRRVFGARVGALTDAQLNSLKTDDRAFFNRVYGPEFQAGRELGNLMPGDGYAFRGRGFIQLTGRSNYARYGAAIGKRDALLANPDLANDPAVSALLTVAYIKDRYHGGGWDALLACVGNNTPDIRATKDRYRDQFLASGEYAARTVR